MLSFFAFLMMYVQLVQSGGGALEVTQFHYTAWPDHGVPDNVMSIISFIRHVRKLFPTSVDQPGPVLVHCSAGIGRSGTFITLDMMMQQMKDKATLSVCQCVRYVQTQRIKMVQTRVCTIIYCTSINHFKEDVGMADQYMIGRSKMLKSKLPV